MRVSQMLYENYRRRWTLAEDYAPRCVQMSHVKFGGDPRFREMDYFRLLPPPKKQ